MRLLHPEFPRGRHVTGSSFHYTKTSQVPGKPAASLDPGRTRGVPDCW
jgi:hypothetical protein